jgi:uncharacterized protein YabN with tetrapyrrole methylase and pyrophosphatase domain
MEDSRLPHRALHCYIEEELARRGRTPGQVTLEEMDALWAEAKAEGR